MNALYQAFKGKKEKKCKICGKNKIYSLGMCRKHYEQFRKYGKTLDKNKRTIYDKNDYIIENNICTMFLYDKFGNLTEKTIFDKKDLQKVKKHKWRYEKKIGNQHGYVTADINDKTAKIHQIILGKIDGLEIDHINHNKLDNRRCNLRFVTRSQNNMNRSGVKGYYFDKNKNKWFSRVIINRKQIYLGYFKTENEAKIARKEAEKKYYKQYAPTI